MNDHPNDVRQHLKENGWRQDKDNNGNEIWFKRREDAPECQANRGKDGVLVIVTFWPHGAYDIDITGEKTNGVWTKLYSYGIGREILRVLDFEVERLVEAWKVMNNIPAPTPPLLDRGPENRVVAASERSASAMSAATLTSELPSRPARRSLAASGGSGSCPTCAAKVPGWWVRDYCAACGGDLPQTAQQAEIERLRDALAEIDDVTGFDYPTMPEASRAKAHEIIREIVLRVLTRQNTEMRDGEYMTSELRAVGSSHLVQ